MVKYLHSFLVILIIFSSEKRISAQSNNYALPQNKVWAFGNNAGLDFNGTNPVPIQTAVEGLEAYASVSDEHGALLFYTNGSIIWNKNHDTLLNGELWPAATASAPTYSVSQGALITSKPGNPNQYYVFSLRTPNTGILSYSVVDMTLDNGLGAVIDTLKNIQLATGLCEKLNAVQGEDCNLWLVVRSRTATEFFSYNITIAGISDTPVVSAAPNLGVASPGHYNFGSLKFSSDRKKAALAGANQFNNPFTQGIFELYDFDPFTGIFSNATLIEGPIMAPLSTGIAAAYGVEFSPDGTKLYTSGFSGGIKQRDLSQGSIITTTFPLVNRATGLALAPDGKIYFKGAAGQYLGCITYPNSAGLAANINDSAIQLLNGTSVEVGLPNTSVLLLPSDTIYTTLDTLVCAVENGVALTASVIISNSKYKWNNGDTSAVLTVNNEGTYWVSYKENCTQYIDSFTVTSTDLFTTINVNGFILGATGGPFVSYQWYLNGEIILGATGANYEVTSNGDYTVEATDENGCRYLSDVYTVSNYEISVRELEQVANSIKVYPNPAVDKLNINSPVGVNVSLSGIDGRLYHRENNVLSISVEDLNSGIYFLNIYDEERGLIKVEKVIKR